MPEVVDPERHLVAVGGALQARNLLQPGRTDDGLYLWQHASPRIVDETAYRRQRCQVQLHDRASLLGAEPLYRGRAALRVAYRQDHMPGRVSGQQCACTFETQTGVGSGDNRGSRRIGHFASRRIGMSAVSACQSRRYMRGASVGSVQGAAEVGESQNVGAEPLWRPL